MNDDYVVTDEMRDLIIRYMEACNKGEDKLADSLLIQIKHENSNSISPDSN
jgi:hypothetical protein